MEGLCWSRAHEYQRDQPGSALPVVREVRLPGINLMTLLIKVAGGRELVMVHLGARESHSRAIGRSIPHGLNFESLRSFRGAVHEGCNC